MPKNPTKFYGDNTDPAKAYYEGYTEIKINNFPHQLQVSINDMIEILITRNVDYYRFQHFPTVVGKNKHFRGKVIYFAHTHEKLECYPWVVSVPCIIKGKSLLTVFSNASGHDIYE